MPISEDEYDSHQMAHEATMQQSMSKADLRKTHKPIMEKKRRARINQSLNEIKSLILEALNKDPARHTKLEKADILEMAVKHLQNVQKQQLAIAMASDPTVLQKFKSGFNECSDEVMNYIGQIDLDTTLKQRLQSHLGKCINNVEQMAQFNLPAIAYPFLNNTLFGGAKNCDATSTTNGDQNNNPRIQIPQGLQLIPSRLPTGEFAFLVPNANNLPYFPSSIPSTSKETNNTARSSAFEAVIPSANARILSPPLSPSQSHLKSNQDDLLLQRTPSPHGFRPVNPNLQKRNIFIPNNELIQKPTVIYQSDVKTMKYPINNQERKYSPRKIIEPLCIITNQAERFKQAHTLEDSANYEENIQQQQHQQQQHQQQQQHHQPHHQQPQHQPHQQQQQHQQQRGIKRKFHDGLLSLATNQSDSHYHKSKTIKIIDDLQPSTSKSEAQDDDDDDDDCQEVPSKDQYESSNDMWRPW